MSEQTWPRITMYSTTWCSDCARSRRFLRRHGIPFEEIDIDHDRAAARSVVEMNRGLRSVPTIVIDGGPTLIEPRDHELAAALGVELGNAAGGGGSGA